MTAFTIYPDNPLEIETEIPVFDTTTRKEIPLTAGTVTAFLASSNLNNATAIDLSVSVTVLPPLSGKKKWLAKFPASVMTFNLLNGTFGSPSPAGLILTSKFTAANNPSAIPPYANAADVSAAWTLVQGTAGIRSNRLYFSAVEGTPPQPTYGVISADTGVMSWDVSIVFGAPSVEAFVLLGASLAGGGITIDAFAGLMVVYSQTVASDVPVPRVAVPYIPAAGDVWRIILTSDSLLTVSVNGSILVGPENGFTADQRPGSLLYFGMGDTVGDVVSLQVMTAEVPVPYIVLTMANGFREVIGPGEYLETKVAEIAA